MASRTLTPERVLRRPWRFDRRLLLSLLVTLAAVGGMFAYAGSLAATRPVVVATHDLPAGAILGQDDLAIAQVRLDATIYAAAVPGDALAQVIGQQLAEPVHRQQILARAQLSSRARLASGELALTIPITAASAVDGQLRPGDDVQVLLTRTTGAAAAETVVVLERVTIYSIGYDERATFGNPTGSGTASGNAAPLASLTLVVTAEQARTLANARHSGELDVALLPPLASVTAPAQPPATAPPAASPTVSGPSQ